MESTSNWFSNYVEKLKTRRLNRKALKKEIKQKKKEYRKNKNWLYRFTTMTIQILLKTITWIFGLSAITAIIVAIIVYPYIKEARETAYDSLKNVTSDFFKLNSNTLIYDKDDNVICEVNSGSFTYDKLTDVSNYITDGYIAVEDKNFKSHPGIDITAISRAGLKLIKNNGEITQGGSTITQQLIKNTMLTKKQTFQRKLAEMFIALDFEAQPDVNKELIMEYYINTNFYGNNRYGVESACNYYFNCSAKDVTVAQAAMIVGISNSPSKYNPVANYDLCIERARFCLDKMYENNAITEAEYNKALEDFDNGVEIYEHTDDLVNEDNYLTTYALYCASIKLMEQDGFEFRYTFDNEADEDDYNILYNEKYNEKYNEIHAGGYEIHTSLDLDIQKEVQRAIDEKLEFNNEQQDNGIYALQSAATVIDNSNNYVVAIVGGRTDSGEYNRGYQAARQPGSSIKPIVAYGPAFDTGEYYPSKIITDGPVEGEYQPSNWYNGYWGNVSIRYALEQSINTVAYKTLYNIGLPNGLEYLAKMKFSHLSYADYSSNTVALGGFTYGTTPYEMAKAYNTMQNRGKYSDRTCIKVLSKLGETVYNSASEETTQVYTADTSYMITSCLKDITLNGTGKSAAIDGQIVAGKTGTTNGSKDLWYCGYTKYYTASVWVGYDTPREMSIDSQIAMKVFNDFMTVLHDGKQEADWSKPETVIEGYVDYKGDLVDYDTGKTDYFSTSNNKKFKVVDTDEAYDKATIALNEFEAFVINSEETMKEYYNTYDNVLKLVDNVKDEYKHSELNKRLVNRKETLDKQYRYYKDLYDKNNIYNEEQQSLADKQAEEEASSKAEEQDISNKINTINKYISQIKSASNYGNTEKQIEKAANDLLSQIKDKSSQYDSLKSSLDSEVKKLQEKTNKETTAVPKPTETQPVTTKATNR